mmetsp:Transcript_37556/g.99844  ORF Transcript_37556/g.99844 Transcript_37556/m.99844 type:complete len:220 (+) Transcript_37556:385-1044(+)
MFKLTLVRRVVGGLVNTLTVLLAMPVTPLEGGPVQPGFDASTMLEIFLPLALVRAAVCVYVGALTVGLVVKPLALVDITVNLHEPTLAHRPVVGKLSLIDTDAFLLDLSKSMPFVAKPLSSVIRIFIHRCPRSGPHQGGARLSVPWANATLCGQVIWQKGSRMARPRGGIHVCLRGRKLILSCATCHFDEVAHAGPLTSVTDASLPATAAGSLSAFLNS